MNNAVEKVENIVNKEKKEREIAKKRLEKQNEKEVKLAKRQRAKEQRKAEKNFSSEKKDKSGQNGKPIKNVGYRTAIVALSLSTVMLGGALAVKSVLPNESENALTATIEKSFYDTEDGLKNMNLNLSKITVADKNSATNYLLDLAVNAELCESNISNLPLKDENKFYTAKVINQIGDYAKYLHNKLVLGESLSEQDERTLLSLKRSTDRIMEYLDSLTGQISVDNDINVVLSSQDNLAQLKNLSVEYPELIYDGPFSDGREDREIKGLKGEEISRETAENIFVKAFGGLGLTDVTANGETSGNFKCFNLYGKISGGDIAAQISKIGGEIVMFDMSGECNAVNYEEDYALDKAVDFLSGLEIENMMPVWVNLSNNVYTVNLAYSLNGTPVYSDLIKVKICADTGSVLGLEAQSYYINHTERELETPILSADRALEYVSSNISVDSVRLAVIPKGETSEKLCYEVNGTFDGATYYIYINSATGEYEEIFKVIESTEGKLLM